MTFIQCGLILEPDQRTTLSKIILAETNGESPAVFFCG